MHTNIVNCYDIFDYQIGTKVYNFGLQDVTDGMSMIEYIDSLKLDMKKTIPQSYIEIIFDCMIQITQGMDFAHSHGLVHGEFGIKHLVVVKGEKQNVYKINNFRPHTNLVQMQANKTALWPFAKGKKQNQNPALEILMLKDIYSLGICLIELMKGR